MACLEFLAGVSSVFPATTPAIAAAVPVAGWAAYVEEPDGRGLVGLRGGLRGVGMVG